MTERRHTGNRGEDLAVDFLEKKGYRIIERNFRFSQGEIDIVADDAGVLVFVEVKARWSVEFGEPEDAISVKKRKQLRRIAEGYLYKKEIEGRECRFDVVAIKFERDNPSINHLIDAF